MRGFVHFDVSLFVFVYIEAFEAEIFQCVHLVLSNLFSLSGSRSSTGDDGKFQPEPRASDLKPIKNTIAREKTISLAT